MRRGVGVGVEWLYWSYAYASLRAAQDGPAATPREALRPGLRRFWLRLVGLALFAAAVIGTSAAFSWPRGVQELVVAAALFAVVLRLPWVCIRLPLPAVPPRLLVFFFWRDDEDGVAPNIARSAARFVVVLVALGRCALVVEAPLASLASSESLLMHVSLRLIGVATLVLLTHMVWITVRTLIDQRLARVPSGEQHGPHASSRLLTLLPLLRVTSAVLLVAMLVLSSLWALGIEITPLLAGAGVVGIALGFGAQALVRDVIAGVFYLAEDAFRIGEYIEAGGNSKGMVERITLRSVALRHHNGPLHFVPYGALGPVRNT